MIMGTIVVTALVVGGQGKPAGAPGGHPFEETVIVVLAPEG